MKVDHTLSERREKMDYRRLADDRRSGVLSNGEGGGTSDGMEERVARLETHFEYVRKDLDEIKTSLKKLDSLPTKQDLDSWRWQWLATGIAILALTVGGITGGLALIAKFAS